MPKFLVSMGCEQSVADPTLYCLKRDGCCVFLIVSIDDILLFVDWYRGGGNHSRWCLVSLLVTLRFELCARLICSSGSRLVMMGSALSFKKGDGGTHITVLQDGELEVGTESLVVWDGLVL